MPADAPAAFFSYCRDDSDFALRLAEDLKAAGAAVWIDQLDIEPGMRWDRAVEDALNNCPRMLVILSPASVQNDNVRDEVSVAIRKQKNVIPVLYLDCDIPLRLERHQHIDFRSDYARGLKLLLKTLGVYQPPQRIAPARAEVQEEREPDTSDTGERQRSAEQGRKQAAVQALLEEEHKHAAAQAVADYRVALSGSVLGFVVILAGICLAWAGKLTIGIVGTTTGLIAEALSYLFFKRVDLANSRMDDCLRELLESRGAARKQDAVQALLEEEHKRAAAQAKLNHRVASAVYVLGFVIIFAGICLAWAGKLTIGIVIVGTTTGLIAEALSYLFFRRVDLANSRMDDCHRELLESLGFAHPDLPVTAGRAEDR